MQILYMYVFALMKPNLLIHIQVSFYQPTKERHKILIENQCFPSDFVRWIAYGYLHIDV